MLSNIVILVVGETGAGKSYFINKLLEAAGIQHRVTIGQQIRPCTVDITHVFIPGLTSAYPVLSGFQVDVIDTPGFNSDVDPASDQHLLKRIETWLKENCRDGAVLGGIIYLHDISKDRHPGQSQKNLATLQRFLKEGSMDKVVLVTSKWGRTHNRTFDTREKQLLLAEWAPMVSEGAHVKRFKAEGAGPRRFVGNLWKVPPPNTKKPSAEISREILAEDEAAAAEAASAKDIVDGILGRLVTMLNDRPLTPVSETRCFASRPRSIAEAVEHALAPPVAAETTTTVPPRDLVPEGELPAEDEATGNDSIGFAVSMEKSSDDREAKPSSRGHSPIALLKDLHARDEVAGNETVGIAIVEEASDDQKFLVKTSPMDQLPISELQYKDEVVVDGLMDDHECPAETLSMDKLLVHSEIQAKDKAVSNEAAVVAVVEESSDHQYFTAKTPAMDQSRTAGLQAKIETASNEDAMLAVMENSLDDQRRIAKTVSIDQLVHSELDPKLETRAS